MDHPVCIFASWVPRHSGRAFGETKRMKKLTLKQWMVALLVGILAIASLGNLAVAYFLGVRLPSAFSVHKEDQWAIEQFHILATNAFFAALTSGLVLGICLAIAYRWITRGRGGLPRGSKAEPCAPPNGGPATSVGDSGVAEGPPSVS